MDWMGILLKFTDKTYYSSYRLVIHKFIDCKNDDEKWHNTRNISKL